MLIKNNFLSSPLLVAAFSLLALLPGQAESAGQHENRFLFIIDGSSAMRANSNAVAQCVADLMESNMRGEFRAGDTIGLWTYNDKLHPEFPMQVWSKRSKDAISSDMAAFLQAQHYEKSAHFERVMPALNSIIKNSERITMVLISDGRGAIQGTPFDKDIATLQKKYARELRAAHAPFVLVLAAREGAVFDYTINYPGTVAIPHTAFPEPEPTNAPVAQIIPTVTNFPPKLLERGHSIIMSRATNTPPATVPSPVLTVTTPPPPVKPVSETAPVLAAPPPVEKLPVTNMPPLAIQPAPAPAAVAPKISEPVVVVPPLPAAPTVISNTPKPIEPAPAPPVPIAQIQPASNAAISRSAPIALFVMGFLLLTIAALLAVFLVRRSRSAAESSLITQSIDHH